MHCGESFANQLNCGIFGLVQIQGANEASRFISRIKFDLNVSLHIPPSGKISSLGAVRLRGLALVPGGTGGSDTYKTTAL